LRKATPTVSSPTGEKSLHEDFMSSQFCSISPNCGEYPNSKEVSCRRSVAVGPEKSVRKESSIPALQKLARLVADVFSLWWAEFHSEIEFTVRQQAAARPALLMQD